MAKSKGSSSKTRPDRKTSDLSKAESADVKGGAISPTASSSPSPILRPINPRTIIPCF